MSVRNGVLALLVERPMYGAELRTEFERRTGGTWPLNVGQVYTTLDRLERDGLVETAGPADDEGRIRYRPTGAGRDATARWWRDPVVREPAPRSELAIKLALAVTLPDVEVVAVVQSQRNASVRHLHDLTRLKREALGDFGDERSGLAWSLVLEHLIFSAEAEVRWLDHVETWVQRAAAARPTPAPDRGAWMSGPHLVLDRVSRTYGHGDLTVHALNRVSLTVARGELVAVMGPSGSGKSTLLNLAGALDAASSGRVLVDGVDLGSLGSRQLALVRRRQVGFVFQDLNLIPSLTVAENAALPLELDGVAGARSRALALDGLADVGLDGVADRFPDQLSGGQRQRVAIVRALIGDRRLLLADEPTGALDSHTGEAVLALVRRRCDEGAAGLLVTHEARHAAWADRTVFLRDGAVVDSTGPEPEPLEAVEAPS